MALASIGIVNLRFHSEGPEVDNRNVLTSCFYLYRSREATTKGRFTRWQNRLRTWNHSRFAIRYSLKTVPVGEFCKQQ